MDKIRVVGIDIAKSIFRYVSVAKYYTYSLASLPVFLESHSGYQ